MYYSGYTEVQQCLGCEQTMFISEIPLELVVEVALNLFCS